MPNKIEKGQNSKPPIENKCEKMGETFKKITNITPSVSSLTRTYQLPLYQIATSSYDTLQIGRWELCNQKSLTLNKLTMRFLEIEALKLLE